MCKKYNGSIARTAARVENANVTETVIPKKAIPNGIENNPKITFNLKAIQMQPPHAANPPYKEYMHAPAKSKKGMKTKARIKMKKNRIALPLVFGG